MSYYYLINDVMVAFTSVNCDGLVNSLLAGQVHEYQAICIPLLDIAKNRKKSKRK